MRYKQAVSWRAPRPGAMLATVGAFVLGMVATVPVRSEDLPSPPMSATADPREPKEFNYGQSVQDSKMTPSGSEGRNAWTESRDDIGPPKQVDEEKAEEGRRRGERQSSDRSDKASEVRGKM